MITSTLRFLWALALMLVFGCGDRLEYSARILHANPAGQAIPPGASVAVYVEGTRPGDIPTPDSAGERVIRVLARQGHPVRRIAEDDLGTCTEDRALVLGAAPEGDGSAGRPHIVTVRVLECRTRRELALLRFRLELEGTTITGPGPEDVVVGRTLTWLGVPGPHEPERPRPLRNGGFIMQTSTAFALVTKKKVLQEIPYYRTSSDWESLALQSYAFGSGSRFLDTRLEYFFGIHVVDRLGESTLAGPGVFVGLEYGFPTASSWDWSLWGHGTAGLLTGLDRGSLLQAAAGASLRWFPRDWIWLFARAGLGGQWLETLEHDVIWDRPREIRLDSFTLVLTAGVSLNW